MAAPFHEVNNEVNDDNTTYRTAIKTWIVLFKQGGKPEL